METAVCVSGFLLILFSAGAQLSPDPNLLLGSVGGSTLYNTQWRSISDYALLYRVSADADLLLANCSRTRQPVRSKPDGYEVECDISDLKCFRMSNLTMSHSGDYRTEVWTGGDITGHGSFRLIVCAEGQEEEVETVYDGDDAVVCRMDSTLGNGSSLQVYRSKRYERHTLVLDTNSSLEPLVEDLRGRLQVDLSTSLVTLSGVTRLDYDKFYCTVWRGAQCQSYRSKRLYVADNLVFAHAGENITLPCISKGASPRRPYEVEWETPTGRHKFNMSDQQEVMYRTRTGNYSLFIPSVSQQHSGEYECLRTTPGRIIWIFHLYVCPLVSPLDVMFSHGESVHLNFTQDFNFSSVDGIMWYRQKVQEPQVLILDSRKGSASLPEDLRGRVSLRGQVTWRGRETLRFKLTEGERLTNSPLILSSLTAEDSGLYTWRVYEQTEKAVESGNYDGDTEPDVYDDGFNVEYKCFEGSFHLVYKDLFGVHSPFYRAYAPLMGCGLLGLVAAVIWFSLRSRRGEQTSGRQSREGQQSEDEDLYDDVEMAEISG